MTDRLRKYFVEPEQRFERLVVMHETRIPRPNRPSGIGQLAVRCHCDCGNEVTVLMTNFCRGASQSCGCLDREKASIHRLQLSSMQATHGLSRHPLYKVWNDMMDRCENPNHKDYLNYGDRGITVCRRWHDVRLFIEDILRDIGSRPPGMSLDRTDNNGGYGPGKVRWATAVQQAQNRRSRDEIKADRAARAAKALTVAGW